jgi:transcriptional regulator with GAF, ATPase, and Fis domain
LFGAKRARLYAIDSDSGLIEKASADIEGADPSTDADVIRRAAEQVYRTQEPLLDTSEEGGASPSLAESEARSLLAIPLRFRGRTYGILYLDSRPADGVFRADDRDLLQLVGNHLLLLLESARAREYEQKIADSEERSAALLEHATRAVEIGVATMQPDESLARVSPTVHTMVEPWQTTAVWWDRVLDTIDWPDPQTCPECGNPEYVGEVLADFQTPADDGVWRPASRLRDHLDRPWTRADRNLR